MGALVRNLALAAALLLLVGVYATAGPLFHLYEVKVSGDSWAIKRADVRAALAAAGPLTLVFADFAKLEEGIARLPQVREARVSLLPPHRIELNVVAREAVARAVDGGLIDLTGEWYAAAADGDLPIFAMERADMPQAVEHLAAARAQLKAAGIGVTQLHHADQGWRIFLSNGWVLLLGEQMVQRRLARFSAALPTLQARLAAGANLRFDLRYPHGMAVAGWQRTLTPPPSPKQRRKDNG